MQKHASQWPKHKRMRRRRLSPAHWRWCSLQRCCCYNKQQCPTKPHRVWTTAHYNVVAETRLCRTRTLLYVGARATLRFTSSQRCGSAAARHVAIIAILIHVAVVCCGWCVVWGRRSAVGRCVGIAVAHWISIFENQNVRQNMSERNENTNLPRCWRWLRSIISTHHYTIKEKHENDDEIENLKLSRLVDGVDVAAGVWVAPGGPVLNNGAFVSHCSFEQATSS